MSSAALCEGGTPLAENACVHRRRDEPDEVQEREVFFAAAGGRSTKKGAGTGIWRRQIDQSSSARRNILLNVLDPKSFMYAEVANFRPKIFTSRAE